MKVGTSHDVGAWALVAFAFCACGDQVTIEFCDTAGAPGDPCAGCPSLDAGGDGGADDAGGFCATTDECTAGLVCDENRRICVVPTCEGELDFTPCMVATTPDLAYDVCVDGACVSPGACGDETCNVPGPDFPMPPAVITGSPYTRTVPAANEPVVVDSVTGLMWQGCVAGLAGDLESCWGEPTPLTWSESVTYCDALTWGGFDDWHLPDEWELISLVDYGVTNPMIDAIAFPGTPATDFATSSSYSREAGFAWWVSFENGFVRARGGGDYGAKDTTLPVRCVRRDQPTVVQRFERVATDEPVVHDAITGLMWQACQAGTTGSDCGTGSGGRYTWNGALSYCDGLAWGGHSDWRLPDIKELWTIRNNRTTTPTVDVRMFPRIDASVDHWYWSATTWPHSPSAGFWCNFVMGYTWTVEAKSKGTEANVLCVRVAE